MAAKEAIFELLKDCSLSKEDLTENILTCVRQHKLGTVPIARYAKEALKLDNLDSERFGSTVESHVKAMVDVARSTDTHSRGSQTRGAVDDDVTVDLDSDNLDADECIEERDSDMARGSAKAKSLARAAIAEADHQEKGGNEPVGDGKKPEDNASTEDVRPTSGDAYDEATVSADSQTLDVLKQIMETLEREREESRNREDRLNRQIKDLSGKLQHLTTQVEKQAKIINEERSAAQDRETRMKNKVQDLEKIVRELSGSVGDVLKTQAKALRENKENSTKIARQLNDLKELSTPHTKNDTSAVPQKPTTNPREGAKSTNQKAEDERKRKSGPSSPEKKQRGGADFEPRQRTSSWPDESDKTREPWADESEVVQHSGTQPTQKNEWVDAVRRQKRMTPDSVHEPAKKPLGKLLGVPRIRRRAFYVGGIDPECCAEDLQDFCKDVCPLMGCRVMPSRRTGTRCAYIEVDETKVETFRSIIWPENLYARDWSFSERDGQQTKNKNDK